MKPTASIHDGFAVNSLALLFASANAEPKLWVKNTPKNAFGVQGALWLQSVP